MTLSSLFSSPLYHRQPQQQQHYQQQQQQQQQQQHYHRNVNINANTTDMLRRILLASVLLLFTFTLSNLKHFQNRLDSVTFTESSAIISFVTSPTTTTTSSITSTSTSTSSRSLHGNSQRKQLQQSNDNDNNNNNNNNNDNLGCLVHESMELVDIDPKRMSNPNQTRLEHGGTIDTNNNNTNNNNISFVCGTLQRRDWRYHKPKSRFAKLLEQHQTNCSLPVATHYMDNTYGLGSHLILWGQALCNSMQQSKLHFQRIQDPHRMRSLAIPIPHGDTTTTNNKKKKKQNDEKNLTYTKEWIWLDQQHCSTNIANQYSSLLCYFPNAEYRCSSSSSSSIRNGDDSNTNLYNTLHDTTNNNNSNNTTIMARRMQQQQQQAFFLEEENDYYQQDTPNSLSSSTPLRNVSNPRTFVKWCPLVQESDSIRAEYRAAATEFLFQKVSPLVIQEANRQMGIVFADTLGRAPHDLITVHIRWGDKFWEMDLPSIAEYMTAILALLYNVTDISLLTNEQRQIFYNNTTTDTANTTTGNLDDNLMESLNSSSSSSNFTFDSIPPANIYLATEDPRAYQEFMAAKPDQWKVYADITLHEINAFRPKKGNRASWATKNTKGRAGLIALGSLLVAMEANKFVLTTKSNWSSLINHLRTNIVDAENNNNHLGCNKSGDNENGHDGNGDDSHDGNNCTLMIDLRPGLW